MGVFKARASGENGATGQREGTIRSCIEDGRSWFCGKDALRELGYSESSISNITKAFRNVPAEQKRKLKMTTLGGEQEALCISAEGLEGFLERSRISRAAELLDLVKMNAVEEQAEGETGGEEFGQADGTVRSGGGSDRVQGRKGATGSGRVQGRKGATGSGRAQGRKGATGLKGFKGSGGKENSRRRRTEEAVRAAVAAAGAEAEADGPGVSGVPGVAGAPRVPGVSGVSSVPGLPDVPGVPGVPVTISVSVSRGGETKEIRITI